MPEARAPELKERILFYCDVISFSTIIERLRPAQAVEAINEYYAIVTRNIEGAGGRVESLASDRVSASLDAGDTDAAVQCALDLLDESKKLRKMAEANSPLRVLYLAVGMTRGKVVVGSIGAPGQQKTSAMGPAVGLASRYAAAVRRVPRPLIFDGSVEERINLPYNVIKVANYKPHEGEPYSLYSIDYGVTSRLKTADDIRDEVLRFAKAQE